MQLNNSIYVNDACFCGHINVTVLERTSRLMYSVMYNVCNDVIKNMGELSFSTYAFPHAILSMTFVDVSWIPDMRCHTYN